MLFIRIYFKFHPETFFFCCFQFYSRVDRWENIWNALWCVCKSQQQPKKKNVIADKGFCQDKKQITNSNISILFLLKKHFVVKRTNKRKVNNPRMREMFCSIVSLWDPVSGRKENFMEQKTAVATNSKKRSLKS